MHVTRTLCVYLQGYSSPPVGPRPRLVWMEIEGEVSGDRRKPMPSGGIISRSREVAGLDRSESPPAERVASGCPLEGGLHLFAFSHVGRAAHRSDRGNQNQMLSERSEFIWFPPGTRSTG